MIVIVLSSYLCQLSAQNRAKLDNKNSLLVGQTVTIKSQFEGLPVVEPHISVNPQNGDHLLVAGMIVTDPKRPYQSCRLSSFVSLDGGKTWKETSHDWWGYDPWTGFSQDGKVAMSWIGTESSFKHQYPINFFFSDNGGIDWQESVQTENGNYDGTKISIRDNEFYFTTVRFRHDMGADVILYQSKDQYFNEVARIDGDGTRLNFCEPAILSDGKVVVPAAKFLGELWVQVFDPNLNELSAPYHVTNESGGARGYMRLTIDDNPQSRFSDRLYFVRALGSKEQFGGVWINTSNDGGKTWSEDTRIDLFKGAINGRALVPSVSVNNQGVLGISWVDTQDEFNKQDVYFTISLDGGVTFQRLVRVTDISTDPRTEANDDVANKFPGGGHYLGMDAKPDGSFQLIWSDSRSGFFELQTANVQIISNEQP